MRKSSDPETTEIPEEASEVSEEPIPNAEVPEPEVIEEPQPEPEPMVEAHPEPEPVAEPEVEEAVEELVETAVEDVVAEEIVEPVVEEEPVEEAPLNITSIKFNFNPPSPFFGPKVIVGGVIEGLGSEPKFYLSVSRLVEGNGTEPVGECGLVVEGDRTVAQIRKTSQDPLLAYHPQNIQLLGHPVQGLC